MAQAPPAALVSATSHPLTATLSMTRATHASAPATIPAPTQEAPISVPEPQAVQVTATSPALVVTSLAILAILVLARRVILARTRAAMSMVVVPLVVLDMVTSLRITAPMMRALASTAVR